MNFRNFTGLSNFIRRILGPASFPRRSQVVPLVSQDPKPVHRAEAQTDIPTL